MSTFVCVIDPGHGGEKDAFRTSPRYGLREADVNLAVAEKIKALCASKMRIHFTRLRDEQVSIAKRVALAKELDAQCFLSVHHNFTSLHSKGLVHPMVFIHKPYRLISPLVEEWGLALLDAMGRRIYQHVKLPPRYPHSGLVPGQTIFSEGMGVLRGLHGQCPAYITEAGFLSDSATEKAAAQGTFVDDEAYALSNVLCQMAEQSWTKVSWSPMDIRYVRRTERVRVQGQIDRGPSSVTLQGLRANAGLVERWGGFDVQKVASGVRYVAEMDLETFLSLEALHVSSDHCLMVPDTMDCVAPKMRVHGTWGDLWPQDIAHAVRDRTPPSRSVVRWIQFGLKIFPNHPYHLEARQYMDQCPLGG